MARFSILVLLLISVLASNTLKDDAQCAVDPSPEQISPFPNKIYLTPNETIYYNLNDYLIGANLTINPSYDQNFGTVNVTSKFRTEFTTPFNFSLQAVQSIFWDDVSFLDDDLKWQGLDYWTSKSLVAILLDDLPTGYSLYVTNVSNIQSNPTNTMPIFITGADDIYCFEIIGIGNQTYVIDCVAIMGNNPQNYFVVAYYSIETENIEFLTYVPNVLSFNYQGLDPFTARHTKPGFTKGKAPANYSSYVVRYYSCLDLPLGYATGYEIFDFTGYDIMSPPPQMIPKFFDGNEYYFASNLSTLQISSNFLYSVSCYSSVYTVEAWSTTPFPYANFSFPSMFFISSALTLPRYINGETIGETFIAFGQLYKMTLSALVLSPNQFLGIFELPIPSDFAPIRNFRVYSSSVGGQYAAVSYSVNSTYQSPCVFVAVLDITSTNPKNCPYLIGFDYAERVQNVRFNPDNSEKLALISATSIGGYSIQQPYLEILNVTSNLTVTLWNESTADVILMNDSEQIFGGVQETAIAQSQSQAFLYFDNFFFGNNLTYKSIQGGNASSYCHNSHPLNISLPPGTVISGNPLYQCQDLRPEANLDPKVFILDENNEIHALFLNVTVDWPFDLKFVNVTQVKQIYGMEGIPLNCFYLLDYFVFPSQVNGNATLNLLLPGADNFFQLPINSYLEGVNCSNFQVLVQADDSFSLVCLSGLTIYNMSYQIRPLKKIEVTNKALNKNISEIFGFGLHPQYPFTIFVVTKDKLYAINQTNSFNGMPQFYSSEIRFHHEVTVSQSTVVAIFINSIFLILPEQNMIAFLDISDLNNIYMRKYITMDPYDFSILKSPIVSNGAYLSKLSNILYIVANDTSTNNLVVLCLNPDVVNSYIVNIVNIPPPQYDEWLISIQVISLEGVSTLFGEMLLVSNGETLFAWEQYNRSYVAISPPIVQNMTINQNIALEFMVENQEDISAISSILYLSIYQDQKELYTEDNIALEIGYNLTNYSFFPDRFVVGTIKYAYSQTQNSYLLPLLSKTSEFVVPSEIIPPYLTVLNMTKNTYILTEDYVYVLENNSTNIVNRIMTPDRPGMFCQGLYIDPDEVYGVIFCDLLVTDLIFPFGVYTSNRTECNIAIDNFLDLRINSTADQDRGFLFYITQNNLDDTLVYIFPIHENCIKQTNLYQIPVWVYGTNDVNATAFEVLAFNPGFFPTVFIIFIYDWNYGLRVVNLDSISLSYEKIYEKSPGELYPDFEIYPDNIDMNSIKAFNYSCHGNGTNSYCEGNLHFVAANFHAVTYHVVINNAGYTIELSLPEYYLVPLDYTNFYNYYDHGHLVLVSYNTSLGKNSTIELIIFNKLASRTYTNALNDSGSVYRVPVWIYTLANDTGNYTDYMGINGGTFVYLYQEEGLESSTLVSYYTSSNKSTFEVFTLYPNLILTWTDPSVVLGQGITIEYVNGYGTTNLYVTQLLPPPEPSKTWLIFAIGVPVILVGSLIFFFHKRYKKRTVVYSRRKQYDPLRGLTMEMNDAGPESRAMSWQSSFMAL